VIALGADTVVSHESALDLLNLSDVIPDAVHVTVPRRRRYVPRLPRVRVHTTTLPLDRGDIVVREGLRVTSPIRTILDAAEVGVGPEQVEAAVRDAEQRGLLTLRQLIRAADSRPARVRRLIATAAERAG
jgi:predicted transcriptional regulator of viral defense system